MPAQPTIGTKDTAGNSAVPTDTYENQQANDMCNNTHEGGQSPSHDLEQAPKRPRIEKEIFVAAEVQTIQSRKAFDDLLKENEELKKENQELNEEIELLKSKSEPEKPKLEEDLKTAQETIDNLKNQLTKAKSARLDDIRQIKEELKAEKGRTREIGWLLDKMKAVVNR